MIQATLCDFGELLYNCFSSEIYKSPWTSKMIFKFNFFEATVTKQDLVVLDMTCGSQAFWSLKELI